MARHNFSLWCRDPDRIFDWNILRAPSETDGDAHARPRFPSISSCGFGRRERFRRRRKQGYTGRYDRCRVFGCGRDRASRKRRADSARAFDCGDDLAHCILGRTMWSRCLAALGRRLRPDHLPIGRRRRNRELVAKAAPLTARCPLLAQSGHGLVRCTCPLLGVKQTSLDDWTD